LKQTEEAARQRFEASGRKEGAAQLKAIIDEQDRHVRTKIMASNIIGASQRKAMLAEADKVNAAQLARLREQPSRSPPGGATASSVSQPGAAPSGTPPGSAQLLQQAKEAIAQGAPRDKVIERLKQQGVDASGI
jgi:hypothetical protein